MDARRAPVRRPIAPAGGGFLRWVEFQAEGIRVSGYPFGVPAVVALRDRGRLDLDPGLIASSYGGRSPHERSHGESFLALAVHRFGPNGPYLLDEPESAQSVHGCVALLARMHDLVAAGSRPRSIPTPPDRRGVTKHPVNQND